MFQRLSTLVPDVNDLLILDVEEVAGILLVHLASYAPGDKNWIYQQDRFGQDAFFNSLHKLPEYPTRMNDVSRTLMEGWAWLQAEGFLIRDLDQPGPWFFLSRRARRLKTREDFRSYRHSSLLPKGHLHPLISTRVYPAFLRGEYDTAVFQAFREVEIAVREAGRFRADLVGRELMREAFRPVNPQKSTMTPGPLTDTNLPVSEQEGMASLFSGAIGLYKNPQSHRNVPTTAIDAAEVIVFASHLLRIVDSVGQPSP